MVTLQRPGQGPGTAPVSPWPFAGMAGMAAVAFLYGASGMFAVPWWAVGLLGLAWLILLVQGLRWWTPRPRLVAALPAGALVLWFAVLMLGHSRLGWG